MTFATIKNAGTHAGVTVIFLLCMVVLGSTQTAAAPQGAAPQRGELTVTATVVSSVGVMIGPNGEQILIVANAPDFVQDSALSHPKADKNKRSAGSSNKPVVNSAINHQERRCPPSNDVLAPDCKKP